MWFEDFGQRLSQGLFVQMVLSPCATPLPVVFNPVSTFAMRARTDLMIYSLSLLRYRDCCTIRPSLHFSDDVLEERPSARSVDIDNLS